MFLKIYTVSILPGQQDKSDKGRPNKEQIFVNA